MRSADGLGREALNLGLETLDLAKIHEQARVALMAPGRSSGAKDGMIKRAQTFFVEALTRIEQTHHAALEANVRLSQLNERLRRRTGELAATNRRLKKEILRRQATEKALKKSEQHYGQLRPEALDDLGRLAGPEGTGVFAAVGVIRRFRSFGEERKGIR